MTNLAKSNLIFPAIILLAIILLFNLNDDALNTADFMTRFLFTLAIIVIWVIGLCLHEFSHAYSSYRFGDHSVVDKGYLTLNPLLYGDAVTSFIIPVVILLIGGLPLPGGAVYLDHSNIRTRNKIALTYIFGPLANLGFGIILCLIYLWFQTIPHSIIIDYALTLSAFLQFYTFVFNMLPLPGFDGFGALATYMNPQARAKMMKAAGLVLIGFMVSIFIFPQVFMVIQIPALLLANYFGLDLNNLVEGFDIFMGGRS